MPFTTRASQPQLRAAQPLHSAIFRPFSTPSSGVNPIQSTNSSPSSSPTTQTLPTNNHSFPSTKPSTQVPIQQHRNSPIQRRHPPSIVTTSHRTNNAPNSANSSLSHTATSTKRTNLPSPNPQRSSSRIRRAHERLRAMTDDMFENDPMSLPVVFRADLGDDDSFSPDIVSGYLFNGPRARESNATAVPETSSSFQIDHVQEIAIEATAVRQLEFGTDLGEDDEYDGGELACDTSAPEFRLEFSSDVLQHSQKPDEPDHRMDAIYDDLDDIGGWIADSTPAGTDLTKQLDRALSTAPDRGANIGYSSNVFEGKEDQLKAVCKHITETGFIPENLVASEVNWFYQNLGIDDMYFQLENIQTIAQHIMALYSSKIFAYIKNEKALELHLERELEDRAVYIHTSKPGVSQLTGTQYERRIDERYLDISSKSQCFRLESYRSLGTVSSSLSTQLRCYFIQKCEFVEDPGDSTPVAGTEETNIRLVSDKIFLEKATENTLEIYQKIMSQALKRSGPVIEKFDLPNSREKRLVIAYRHRGTQYFFSALSDLYHFYDLFSTRKYVEQFSNGVTICSLYLNQVPNSKSPPIEHSIFQVIKEASLIYCLPTTPLQTFFKTGTLSVQEAIYGYVGWIFAQHFLNRLGSEYNSLSSIIDESNNSHVEVLSRIKKRLRSDTFTREYILDIIKLYPDLIKLCYINFAVTHYINPNMSDMVPSLSYQRIQTTPLLSDEELLEQIRKTVHNHHELMIFESYLTFNKHVLKTNFYQPTKVALSFRMNPAFLPDIEYPNKLFGMFLVIGSEFRGFHLRFKDVARGGIRIVRSRNKEAYSINLRTLFDENYNLAATQQRKNKDIPEGGSKGTILLDVNTQDRPLAAFEKYVDSILDLLIVGQSPGIKEKIVDLYGKPEILFFGPDEGTADMMDWASQHARERGASFWKAFTTGKSQALGGIPHDTFGMTTRSVHQYVLGIYRKLGLKEEQCRKLQTGGPDGDLGSNEIKISKDMTIGIVDGSGVLYDPDGINRDELHRLASKRLMVTHFDVSRLGPKGFRVLVDEGDVKLPDGSVVANGLKFRNEFHLNPLASADVFVPCGGRPEAVDASNVSRLLTADGTPRFKYIVEGANLFITQEARLRLENAGAILFKDASANKGGVTSSSLEVLAALSFNDEEFEEHMMVKDQAHPPAFYSEYVKSVHTILEKNAELEFECLWRESERTKMPKSVLSDQLSFAIIKLNNELQKTTLWDNVHLRKIVLMEAFPKLLLGKLGLETLLKRVPETYVKAIFGSYLASRFVYKYGTEPSQFAFFEFMSMFSLTPENFK